MKKKKCKMEKGVTVIEVVVGIALVSMIILSLYSALGSVMVSVNDARIRLGAMAIANEKLEILRSLPYDSVGTIGGVVTGPLAQSELVSKNGRSFQTQTEVRYVDDVFDGVFPDDAINTDYKKAQITVTWSDSGESVELSSIFVPSGIETNAGGGTLSVNVINSSGNSVSDVTVDLVDLDDDPDISVSTYTDSLGNLIIPGVPSQNYRISVSKSGYESSRSYPGPPEGSFTPIIADLYLVEGYLNSKFFIIDEYADLSLQAVNIADDSTISQVEIQIEGGRKIGFSPDTYTVNVIDDTDESGEIFFDNVSAGQYEILNIEEISTTQHLYLGATDITPFTLDPGEDKEVIFLFADKDIDSVAFNIIDNIEEARLDGAEVHLVGEDFDETVTTGTEGIAFFPNVTESMNAGEYNYTISRDGFASTSGAVSVNKLVQEDIELISQ